MSAESCKKANMTTTKWAERTCDVWPLSHTNQQHTQVIVRELIFPKGKSIFTDLFYRKHKWINWEYPRNKNSESFRLAAWKCQKRLNFSTRIGCMSHATTVSFHYRNDFSLFELFFLLEREMTILSMKNRKKIRVSSGAHKIAVGCSQQRAKNDDEELCAKYTVEFASREISLSSARRQHDEIEFSPSQQSQQIELLIRIRASPSTDWHSWMLVVQSWSNIASGGGNLLQICSLLHSHRFSSYISSSLLTTNAGFTRSKTSCKWDATDRVIYPIRRW